MAVRACRPLSFPHISMRASRLVKYSTVSRLPPVSFYRYSTVPRFLTRVNPFFSKSQDVAHSATPNHDGENLLPSPPACWCVVNEWGGVLFHGSLRTLPTTAPAYFF